MQNRRKFLLQTTLAAGSFVFLKPLKTAALPSGGSPVTAKKLTILNFHRLQSLPSKNSFLFSGKSSRYFQNENYNTLLLSTGNIIETNNTSKEIIIEKLTTLKKAGCDAIALKTKDINNSLHYYNELASQCGLTSLAKTSHYISATALLPYHLVWKGDIKVGIIGNNLYDQHTKIKTEELVARLNKTADFLKNDEGCHLVVSMNPCNNGNECNKNEEKAIAGRTKNVDVIVSSNSALKQPTTYILKNLERHDVVLNYQGLESDHLNNINFSFNNRMEKISFSLCRVA